MDDLTAFIRARLDEDEAAAREAAKYHGKRWHAGGRVDPAEGTVDLFDEDGANVLAMYVLPGDAAHIARHDPARVLREVAAKRAIVNAHVSACTADRLPHPGATVYLDGYTGATEVALKTLAAVWSDHPDYQAEWAPGASDLPT